jgi:hypothetical protein
MEHDTRWSWSGSVGVIMPLSAVVAALHLTDADPAIARLICLALSRLLIAR